MSRITGHGRGWQEPLAVGRWAQFKQRMRQPAEKTDYLIALLVVWPVIFLAISIFFRVRLEMSVPSHTTVEVRHGTD